jgi:hypothetical protein
MRLVKQFYRDVKKQVLRCFVYLVIFIECCTPVPSSMDLPVVPFAYVQNIHTPELNSYKVKKILDNFNEMGYSKIVSYERKFIPIWITEADLREGVLGVAFPTMVGCPIVLDRNKIVDDNMLAHVVIHEYLHCMGYGHSYYFYDVMGEGYYQNQTNYNEYAKELAERVDKWSKIKN